MLCFNGGMSFSENMFSPENCDIDVANNKRHIVEMYS